MHSIKLILATLLIALSQASVSLAENPDSNEAFLPTWKLLTAEQKQQFIAGYLYGWKDAAVVTDIATEYVRENPSKALEGLKRTKELYDLSGLRPEIVAKAIDEFYSQPENGSRALSQAVSAAKSALR